MPPPVIRDWQGHHLSLALTFTCFSLSACLCPDFSFLHGHLAFGPGPILMALSSLMMSARTLLPYKATDWGAGG